MKRVHLSPWSDIEARWSFSVVSRVGDFVFNTPIQGNQSYAAWQQRLLAHTKNQGQAAVLFAILGTSPHL